MTARITNNFGTSAISRGIFKTLPTLKDFGQIKYNIHIFLNQICGQLFLTLEKKICIKKKTIMHLYWFSSISLVLNQGHSSVAVLDPTFNPMILPNMFLLEFQLYIQLVFKAPFCITLPISDQKLWVVAYFWHTQKNPNFFSFFFQFFMKQLFNADSIKQKKIKN